jgi:hypothetical protein
MSRSRTRHARHGSRPVRRRAQVFYIVLAILIPVMFVLAFMAIEHEENTWDGGTLFGLGCAVGGAGFLFAVKALRIPWPRSFNELFGLVVPVVLGGSLAIVVNHSAGGSVQRVNYPVVRKYRGQVYRPRSSRTGEVWYLVLNVDGNERQERVEKAIYDLVPVGGHMSLDTMPGFFGFRYVVR